MTLIILVEMIQMSNFATLDQNDQNVTFWQNGCQKGAKTGTEIVQKRCPKWNQNGDHNGTKMDTKMWQNGPKMGPKRIPE